MLIDSSAVHFAASKQRSYRERTRTRFDALVSFLRAQEWLSDDASARYDAAPENWEFHDHDLSEHGQEFIIQHYHKWLVRLDRRKTRRTFEDHVSELNKLVEASR